MTIQPEQHMMEPESAKEDTMDIRHDISLGEIQMGTHIEPMIDMQLTLGSAFEEEQSDAQTPVADPYPLETLEVDGIVLQGARGQQEFYVPDERDELLEMVEHPSLGRHIDEVQTYVHTIGRATTLSMSSTL